MIRELDVGGIRLVLGTGDAAVLEALDELLPEEPVISPSPLEAIEVSVRDGPTSLSPDRATLTANLEANELPAALRLLMGSILDRRAGAILHGAAVLIDGEAVLCLAPSEGGKTTLCGKVAGRLPVLSDETVALRLDGPVPRISGTLFWSGPPLPTAGGLFPLTAICFLRKGSMGLTAMARPAALAELLREWHLLDGPGATGEALARAERLVSSVPVFELHSTLEGDPLGLLREAAAAGMRRAS